MPLGRRSILTAPRMLVPGLRLVATYELIRGEAAPMPIDRFVYSWRAYSVTTTVEKQCARCGTYTVMPGKRGWRWRYREPKEAGRWGGRGTESICGACFAVLPPDAA